MDMSAVPPIPGPKINPFKGDYWPLTIEFLDQLGKGEDGHVWKVRIEKEVYALKVVCECFVLNTRPFTHLY